MKKIILALLICVLCLPTTLFYGCNKAPDDGINLSVYFENEVKYKVGSGSAISSNLNEFTHNQHDNQVQYSNITFTGKPAWLYKMTLETITFDIYSNSNIEDFQIKIVVTNLKKGDSSLTTSNTLTKEIPVKLYKNKSSNVFLEVQDVFNSISASTTIKIEVDAAYYNGDNKDLDFKIDIMNFKVFGEHKK